MSLARDRAPACSFRRPTKDEFESDPCDPSWSDPSFVLLKLTLRRMLLGILPWEECSDPGVDFEEVNEGVGLSEFVKGSSSRMEVNRRSIGSEPCMPRLAFKAPGERTSKGSSVWWAPTSA